MGSSESSPSKSRRERGLGFLPDPASTVSLVDRPAEEIETPPPLAVVEGAKDHGSKEHSDQNPAVTENEKDDEGEKDVHNLLVKEIDKDGGSGENGLNLDAKGNEKDLVRETEKQQEGEETGGRNPAIEEDVKDRECEGSGEGGDENDQNLSITEHEEDKKSKENGQEGDEKGHESEDNGMGHENNGQNKDCEDESVDRNEGDASEVTKEAREEDDGRKSRALEYPLRADTEDCLFYLRTGMCKFGLNCKFNHPVRLKNQVAKESVKESKEFPDTAGRAECKYYLKTGGCKFGKACKYNHTRGKYDVAAVMEFNFLGLPIRPREKECPYYMRTGSCKYGTNCRFNHPDPTAGGGCDPASSGSISLGGASESTMLSWSSPRTSDENSPFVPMMYPSTPSNHEWNGYQASVYTPERSVHRSRPFMKNSSAVENSLHIHHQPLVIDEFPERPGQPECSYFLKTGDCKYKSTCRYHHPKNRFPKSPPCAVSSHGLPLRPDQNTCSYYERYGICKFGPACKFNHPTNPSHPGTAGLSGPEQLSPSADWEGEWK